MCAVEKNLLQTAEWVLDEHLSLTPLSCNCQSPGASLWTAVNDYGNQ